MHSHGGHSGHGGHGGHSGHATGHEQAGGMVKDPVCGMTISPAQAFRTAEAEGDTYYFCSQKCYDSFVGNPSKYTSSKHGGCC